MYILVKDNIEKRTDKESRKNELLKEGYKLINPEVEPKADAPILDEMSVEELIAYAAEHGIDIGKSTSAEGIIKKIKAVQGGGEADGEN